MLFFETAKRFTIFLFFLSFLRKHRKTSEKTNYHDKPPLKTREFAAMPTEDRKFASFEPFC